MLPLRERILAAWSMTHAGEKEKALQHLEALEDEAMASADAADRATFLQIFAAALDGMGQTERALKAVKAALALDLVHWPEGRGTFLSLHSMVLILSRLGKRDEARARCRELLMLGERLGGMYFAAAVVLAVPYTEPEERLNILERARFHCKTALAEEKPRGRALEDLARTFSSVVHHLAEAYLAEGRIAEAEQIVLSITRLVAPLAANLTLRNSLAASWNKLARIAARRRANADQRLFLRYAAAVLDHERTSDKEREAVRAALAALGGVDRADDPRPLDVYRFLSGGDPMWVGKPLAGAFPVAKEAARAAWAVGDEVDVFVDAERFAHPKQ